LTWTLSAPDGSDRCESVRQSDKNSVLRTLGNLSQSARITAVESMASKKIVGNCSVAVRTRSFALGDIFLGFRGVERDNARAEAYFREALAHGHPDAAAALRLLAEAEITLERKKKAYKFWNPRE
jgi:TPR repeat protein